MLLTPNLHKCDSRNLSLSNVLTHKVGAVITDVKSTRQAYGWRMHQLRKLLDKLSSIPKSAEDIAAQAEAVRLRDELETVRLSQRSAAGENYQSGGGAGSGF